MSSMLMSDELPPSAFFLVLRLHPKVSVLLSESELLPEPLSESEAEPSEPLDSPDSESPSPKAPSIPARPERHVIVHVGTRPRVREQGPLEHILGGVVRWQP